MNILSKLMKRVDSAFAAPPGGPNTFEQKLEVLARCGMALDAAFSASDLLESWDRAKFEEPGFNMVLVALGMTEEQPPWRPHSSNVWHFDTECIEDHGSYTRIAERMKGITQGSLPIENIRDYVDIESEIAWIEFDFHGQPIHIDCEVKDDWVDGKLFKHFVDLLAKSDPSKIFVYYDLHAQDCILACVAKSDLAKLTQSGIAFIPLR